MESMEKKTKKKSSTAKARGGFFSIFLFYFFVAFEFAYMAGPFAIYFYSVYSPVLNFLNKFPTLAWLIKFFLPHVARETSSPVLTAVTIIGLFFSVVGFLIFVIGACQIYYSKLTKKGAVTCGLYKYIRHPQYTSFIVCSFGLLLLWPRYIVVIFFVILLFGYYFLARAEERECEAKFGQSFIDYEKQTGRFFPKLKKKSKAVETTKLNDRKKAKPQKKIKKAIAIPLSFLGMMAMFLLGAFALNELTLNSLYSIYENNSATICLSKIEDEKLSTIMEIAKQDPEVQTYLAKKEPGQAELNYVMPTEWFAAEIPMNGVVYKKGHKSPQVYDRNLYKVIFECATTSCGDCENGKDILRYTQSTTPLIEVWVDVNAGIVTDVKEMPDNIKYDGIPESIY